MREAHMQDTLSAKYLIKKMSKKIRGVIFDFNGVLWWDGELQERAWREFAAKLRGPLSNEEMLVHMHGRPNSYVLGYLVGHEVSGEELLRLTEEKESIYRNLCLEQGANFKLSPGAVEFFDYLRAKHIPFTIATASEITNLLFYFKHLPLDKWFDIKKVAYDDNTFPGKPAPDIYLRAAKDLGLAPRDCLVIEDARSGIQSAHAAGIGLIAALGPKEKHNALRELKGVNLVIENVGELLKRDLF